MLALSHQQSLSLSLYAVFGDEDTVCIANAYNLQFTIIIMLNSLLLNLNNNTISASNLYIIIHYNIVKQSSLKYVLQHTEHNMNFRCIKLRFWHIEISFFEIKQTINASNLHIITIHYKIVKLSSLRYVLLLNKFTLHSVKILTHK